MNRCGDTAGWLSAARGLELYQGGYERLIRSDCYVCAGVNRGGGPGDATLDAEVNQSGASTGNFEPYLIAVPEIAWASGTITSIGFYYEGGGGGARVAWAGIARNILSGGENYPGPIDSSRFAHGGTGFDGEKFRSGTVSVAVSRGEVFWVVTQTNSATNQRGFRASHNYRPCLGEQLPDPIAAASATSYMGIRSSAIVAYDTTITDFPAGGVLLPIGNAPIGPGSANTINRPSTYIRLVRA